MATEKETVTLEEAAQAVEATARRIALLHLSYAKTLVEELGEERGRELITKSIRDFGVRMGEKTREEVLDQRLEPIPENFNAGKSYRIPRFGMSERVETVEVNNEVRTRVHGCVLARVWQEYGEEKLGRLYCYVDPAKYMEYNPDYKQVHTKAVPDSDEFCEMTVRPTTEYEREVFLAKDKDWLQVDK